MIPPSCLPAEWFPLNIYDFACWARQTIAALAVVSAYRPVRPLGFTLDELRTGGPAALRARSARGARCSRDQREPAPLPAAAFTALRERALAQLERWIVERQEADGSWGGIQPPWVYSLIALHLRGYAVEHLGDAARAPRLDGFTIVEGDMRRLEACQSPVWDTALAVIALADAGLPPDHEALRRAGRWLRGRGDPRSGATGRCVARRSIRAAGPSSSRTTTTRTSTTPPRW